jgi:hypothetical protein
MEVGRLDVEVRTGAGAVAVAAGGGGGGNGGAIEVGKLDVKVGTGARTAVDVGTGAGISSVVLGSAGGIIVGIGADGTGIITTGGRSRDVVGSGTAAMDDEGIGNGPGEIGTTDVTNVEGAGGRLANDEGAGKVVYCVKVTVTMRVVGASEGRIAVWTELLNGTGLEEIIGPSMAVDEGSEAPVVGGLGWRKVKPGMAPVGLITMELLTTEILDGLLGIGSASES